MGKNNKRPSTAPEEALVLPLDATPASGAAVVDTHTHIASTFEMYRQKYPSGRYNDMFEFIQAMYEGRHIEAIIDVWCEAPVRKYLWQEIADSALDERSRATKWRGIEYWFVIGVHPHAAKRYTDDVEKEILEAIAHPRCVGWGEIGLDYHYDNSPRDVQQAVFVRQLRHAVKLGKPITIHTREAEEDTERILMEEVPRDHKLHIHCCTDSPGFASRLMAHFPNLYIGITGVITYSSNMKTTQIVQSMSSPSPEADAEADADSRFRILLETDAPYMIPGNIYASLNGVKGKLPICHTAMIPWTADFVAKVAGQGWDAERVMRVARDNARKVYGV